MTQREDIDIVLRYMTEGLDRIQASIDKQRSLGEDTAALQEEFDALESKIKSIAADKALIQKFQAVSDALDQSRESASKASQSQAALADELQSTQAAQEKASREHVAAADALEKAQRQSNTYAIQTAELRREQKETKAELAAAKESLKSLIDEQDRADGSADDLTGAIAAQREEIERLEQTQRDQAKQLADQLVANAKATVTKREAGAAEKELRNELKRSQAAAKAVAKEFAALESAEAKATTTSGKHEQRLEALRGELDAAGIDVRDLAASHARLVEESRTAGRSIKDFGNRVEQAESRAGKFKVGMRALANTLGDFITGAAGRAKDLVFDLGRRMLDLGSGVESARIQFARMEGGLAAGNKRLEELRELSRATGTQFSNNKDIYIQLKNFGIDPLNGSLKAIIDQTAALGKGQGHAERIALALGQAYSKQKLQGEELLQLVEAGVPAYDLLAKATGRNGKELAKMASKGELGRDVIEKLIIEMGKASEGAAQSGLETFNGLLTQGVGLVDRFLTRVADSGPIRELKAALKGANEQLDDTGQAAETVGSIIGAVIGGIRAGFGALGVAWNGLTITIRTGVAVWLEAIQLILVGLSKITFGDLSEGFKKAAGEVKVFSLGLRDQISQDYREIGYSANHIVDGLKGVGRSLAGVSQDSAAGLNGVKDSAQGAAGGVGQLADGLRNVSDASGDTLSSINGLARAALGAGDAAKEARDKLSKIGDDELAGSIAGTKTALADAKAELQAINDAIESFDGTNTDYFEYLTKGAAEAQQQVDALGRELDVLSTEQLDRLDARMESVGITSQRALNNAADSARQLYNDVVAANYPIRDQQAAWESVARAELEAAQAAGKAEFAAVQAALNAEAKTEDQKEAVKRLVAALKEAESASKRLGDEAERNLGRVGAAADRAADSVKQVGSNAGSRNSLPSSSSERERGGTHTITDLTKLSPEDLDDYERRVREAEVLNQQRPGRHIANGPSYNEYTLAAIRQERHRRGDYGAGGYGGAPASASGGFGAAIPSKTVQVNFQRPDGSSGQAQLLDDGGADDFLDSLEQAGSVGGFGS